VASTVHASLGFLQRWSGRARSGLAAVSESDRARAAVSALAHMLFEPEEAGQQGQQVAVAVAR
jgi:hypothetical protein